MFSNSSDAAADNTDIFTKITVNGDASLRIVDLSKQTLTAQNKVISISFPFPIKIDKGTAVIMSNAFTVGTSVTCTIVYGYKVYNSKA